MSREMRDSGVKWIGDIPRDWEISNIKNVCTINGRIGFRGYTVDDLVEEGEGAITLSPTNIVNGQLDLTKCSYISWAKYEESPEIMVDIDDIIFVKTASVGKVCIIEKLPTPMTVNPQFVVLKNIKISSKFLYYILYSSIIQSQINMDISGGVLKTITQRNLGVYKIALCDISKQRKIVEVLQSKVNCIDSIISKTKSTIEDYKLLKQSIITEAMTKGLNTDADMKDSGIEWIGEIAKDWEITKFSRVISKTMNGLTRRNQTNKNTGTIVLRIRDISNSNIDYSDGNRIALTESEILNYSLKDGDILFVRVNGSKKLVGKNAIFYSESEIVAFNDHIIKIQLKDIVTPEFISWALNSYLGEEQIFKYIKTSAGQYTISGEDLKKIIMIIPPVNEQIAISKFLNKKILEISSLVIQKQKLIEDMESYKKSVIYEYITGKKEVL